MVCVFCLLLVCYVSLLLKWFYCCHTSSSKAFLRANTNTQARKRQDAHRQRTTCRSQHVSRSHAMASNHVLTGSNNEVHLRWVCRGESQPHSLVHCALAVMSACCLDSIKSDKHPTLKLLFSSIIYRLHPFTSGPPCGCRAPMMRAAPSVAPAPPCKQIRFTGFESKERFMSLFSITATHSSSHTASPLTLPGAYLTATRS